RCPCCRHRSRRVRSFYHRTLTDLACGGHAVTLHVRVRRFACRIHRCQRRIFAERLANLVAPFARRTL
ncbi:MAG: transposase family protein, partial [Pseudomonadota bacterium]|nr:transposase family protein [Pseudomonadota bacterium]